MHARLFTRRSTNIVEQAANDVRVDAVSPR
jgi:hypothetical protein